jgi:hypothetical protein
MRESRRFRLDLAPGWGLGADSQQWVLRAWKRPVGVAWHPVGYIGSTKTVLRLTLREMGVTPTSEGQAGLDALSKRFLDWRHEYDGYIRHPH